MSRRHNSSPIITTTSRQQRIIIIRHCIPVIAITILLLSILYISGLFLIAETVTATSTNNNKRHQNKNQRNKMMNKIFDPRRTQYILSDNNIMNQLASMSSSSSSFLLSSSSSSCGISFQSLFQRQRQKSSSLIPSFQQQYQFGLLPKQSMSGLALLQHTSSRSMLTLSTSTTGMYINNNQECNMHYIRFNIRKRNGNDTIMYMNPFQRSISLLAKTKLYGKSKSKIQPSFDDDIDDIDNDDHIDNDNYEMMMNDDDQDNSSTKKGGKKKKSSNKLKSKTFYRADRVLANRTGRSRSECFQLLKEHRVHEIININNNHNNEDTQSSSNKKYVVISGPSAKITMNTPLIIDYTTNVPLPAPLLLIYHKPKWVLSVLRDPKYNRPCIISPYPNMHPVGRLDYDTSGLILFSSSGKITQSILHPKYHIEKIYRVTVVGEVNATLLQQQLTNGITTAEGVHTGQLLNVSYIENINDVKQYLYNVKDNIPKSVYNHTDLQQRGYFNILDNNITTIISIITLKVYEGKHRMVRRMLANVNHPVIDLHRIQIGSIQLNDVDTPTNTIRTLTNDEYQWAKSLLVLSPSTSSSSS